MEKTNLKLNAIYRAIKENTKALEDQKQAQTLLAEQIANASQKQTDALVEAIKNIKV